MEWKITKWKKAAVKEKKRTIAISTMTSAMKNTAPSPAVALEASQGTTTEADFNVLSSKSTQGANHQHRFKAATTISTSSVHQSYGTSQSVSFALFNVFDTPQSWQSRTLSSPVMNFMPPLVDPSSCTSNQAQHFRRSSHVVLITATQPMLGGTNEQSGIHGCHHTHMKLWKSPERWSNAVVADITFPKSTTIYRII